MENKTPKSGFLLINKPEKWTSFNVVAKLRNVTKIRKIGHAGTLDPFASGLLIIAIGREATRQINDFIKKDKTYITTLQLGATTKSFDTETEITFKKIFQRPEKDEIKNALKKFLGRQKQLPPMFSAKKINGRKLYDLARAGKTIERKTRNIKIKSLEIKNYDWPELTLRVRCSSGTYIRALGHDIGQELGCGAFLSALQRTSIGKYKVENAKNLEDIKNHNWENFLFLPSPDGLCSVIFKKLLAHLFNIA